MRYDNSKAYWHILSSGLDHLPSSGYEIYWLDELSKSYFKM